MNKKIIIIMGVSGSGKTTIGSRLAKRMQIPFLDADDYHPVSNVRKMEAGIPLDDTDREPWLKILADLLAGHASDSGAVLACSALKEKYRQLLAGKIDRPTWVFLQGDYALIEERIKKRKGHYMPPHLLQSQFEDLEKPKYDITVDITSRPVEIVENILSKLHDQRKSEFGVIGLGVMGSNISLNIAEKGVPLSVYNRPGEGELSLFDDFIGSLDANMDVIGFTDLEPFVDSLNPPRKILLMIKAGDATDHVIRQLTPLLDPGDILIDGGNTHFRDTERRQRELDKKGIVLVGCGISGGEKGARFGPSLMPGGERDVYPLIGPVLSGIAAEDQHGEPCCAYIGPGGSGHFVKMVHNGIEYGEMQLLAEVFHLLSKQLTYSEIADLFETWNQGDLNSYLLEITMHILRKKEGGASILEGILDEAGNKGTGGWSVKAAIELGVVNTIMGAAVFARYQSSDKKKRKAFAGMLGKKTRERDHASTFMNLEKIENAYRFARILNHYQGFEMMRIASETKGWGLKLQEIARLWTNGCIIRSGLMGACSNWLEHAGNLLEVQKLVDALSTSEADLLHILQSGNRGRIPLPALNAAWTDWVSMTSAYLPANLIQAQRDYFGAHTYRKVDDPDGVPHHTNWESDD